MSLDAKQIMAEFERTLRDAGVAAGDAAHDVLAYAESLAPRIEAAVERYIITGDKQHLESIYLLRDTVSLEGFRHSSKFVNEQRNAIAAAILGLARGLVLGLA